MRLHTAPLCYTFEPKRRYSPLTISTFPNLKGINQKKYQCKLNLGISLVKKHSVYHTTDLVHCATENLVGQQIGRVYLCLRGLNRRCLPLPL